MFKLFKKINIFKKYNPEIIIKELQKIAPADSASLSTLGNRQDLIHISFSDNPDNNYHILESALRQADFILADGYFKSEGSMLSSTYFLEKYKGLIEYAFVLPSNQGELLIKTNEKAKKLKKNIYDYSYKELESFYDKNYYLNDCGGYESFRINNAVLDNRLYVVQCLADVRGDEKILDLGCGRGELSYAIAKSGADVLGIDYSGTSIKIAEKNFNGRLPNLNYKKIDFFELDKGLLFDTIVASDLIEHIDAKLAEKFMENIANHLNKDGKFILHTAPNKYIYSYKYKRDRIKAKEMGLYLPENPRSFYESLMHINEQTPWSLKKLFKKYFKSYCVWTANIEYPQGNLSKKPLKADLINQRSIFAIASNGNIIKEDIINLLTQEEINDISGIMLELLQDYDYSKKIKKNTLNTFKLQLINKSCNVLKSIGKNPIYIAYHIKKADGSYIVFDGLRTRLPSVIYGVKQLKNDNLTQVQVRQQNQKQDLTCMDKKQQQQNQEYNQNFNPQYCSRQNRQYNLQGEKTAEHFEPLDLLAIDIECNVQLPDYSGAVVIEFTMVQEGLFWFENKTDKFIKTLEIEIV